MAKEKSVLSDQLDEVAHYMQILGENEFKIRAFQKGATALRDTEYALEDVASGKVKVPGVGEGLKAAIKEFLDTGAVGAREELAAKIPAAVLELIRIPGLGPKKAMLIHEELGVNTIGELEYACRENRLVTLKGFGKAIQAKVLQSIEDLKGAQGKLRLDEALEFAVVAEAALKKKLGKDVEVVRVGDLGRSAEIVERFEFFANVTAKQLLAGARAALDWQEGPDAHVAKPFGHTLSALSGKLAGGYDTTLWSYEGPPDAALLQWLCADASVREKLERAPANFAGWQNSWLESVWVESKRKPGADTYRRDRDGSVKGIFHCHTDFSDGAATLEQMVRGAEKLGYEYIGISDHSQSAFYAQGLKPERIREQHRMIEALQKKVSIRIFHGIESDILADGALDYDDDILESFDFIVGSIHSRFKMEEVEMTDRLVRALENPHITMWGHPTGRLLLARKGYALDWKRCFKAAAENGVAIEINANPHRLDIDWRMGEELVRHRLRVCINPDAHSIEGLDDTIYGELMAEKAMLPKECILNRLGVSEMENYLWSRKPKKRLKSSRG